MRILLVEDNPGDQLLFKMAMKEAGIEAQIETAANSLQCLKLIYAFKPECIVSDIGLPGMLGDDFVSFINRESKNSSNIPVVFLTGTYSREFSGNQMTIGEKTYPVLKKPADGQKLKEAIEQVTGKKLN